MKRIWYAVTAIALVTMACGFNMDLGGSPGPPPVVASPVPPQVVYVTAVPPPTNTAAPTQPLPPPTETPVPTPSEPPMVTATGPVDCLPYPKDGFMYLDGLSSGMTAKVYNKAEPQLAEPDKTWYRIKFNDGGADFDCWVYSGSKYLTTSGDFSQVKVKVVIIPKEPPKPHCDTDVKVAKAREGVRVRLPYSQREWLGHTGWFDGMRAYSGRIAHITYVLPYWDISGCRVVYVDIDGGDYGWRIADLNFSLSEP